MFFQKRVNRPGKRAQLPTGKVGNHVLRAVRHQQANHVAFPDCMRCEHSRGGVYCAIEFSVSETSPVCLREHKRFIRRGAGSRFQEFAQIFRPVFRLAGFTDHRGEYKRSKAPSSLRSAGALQIVVECAGFYQTRRENAAENEHTKTNCFEFSVRLSVRLICSCSAELRNPGLSFGNRSAWRDDGRATQQLHGERIEKN